MWNFKTFIKLSDECFVLFVVCFVPQLCLACVKKMNFKIHWEPGLGTFGFSEK